MLNYKQGISVQGANQRGEETSKREKRVNKPETNATKQTMEVILLRKSNNVSYTSESFGQQNIIRRAKI